MHELWVGHPRPQLLTQGVPAAQAVPKRAAADGTPRVVAEVRRADRERTSVLRVFPKLRVRSRTAVSLGDGPSSVTAIWRWPCLVPLHRLKILPLARLGSDAEGTPERIR